jgi:Family of unknown function (DUF6062)
MSDRDHSRTARKRPPSVLAKIALDDGLSSGGCPICYAARKALRRYLHSFLYEGMMSPIARQEFLDCGGFCQQHFWQAKGIEEECWADGIGISILGENLLDASLNGLASLAKERFGLRKSLLKFRRSMKERTPGSEIEPWRRCLACKVERDSEKHYLSTLEDLLGDTDFGERFKKSAGLCLRHTHASIRQWNSEAAMELVNHSTQERVRLLLDQLREFQRKHDYQFKHEPRGPEWSSPERAIDFLVGPRAGLGGIESLVPALKTRH